MTTGRPAGAGASPSRMQAALPKHWYVDQDHWRRERDAVLFDSWLCVGRIDQLGLADPSRLAVVDVAGESILLTRDAEQRLHGAYNVCRHRGSQVVPITDDTAPPACGAAQSLRCPYHSWTYDLSGRLLRAPHTDGVDDFDPADFGLTPVAVQEWRGFCFVHLSPDTATDLTAELADFTARLARYPLESLVVGRRYDYDVRANYKVLLENFNECYHCGPVHPELTRLVPAFGGGGTDLDWDAGVPHRADAWTFTMTGTTTRAPFPDLDENERTRHKGELIYPNLLLSCSADHVMALVLWPLAADRTRVTSELLFAPDEAGRDDFDPDDAGELWDLVNRQDWAVCESVQRGMNSRAYRQGWFAPMEDWSADIRRWIVPRLEGIDD
ncbi:MAG TPA: aromatic ring-hydroxylating dioxygenase subunit alpha [Nocardioidaceae bacterium]|nr:aromatic ring-hydroxylating dioxygenase subunit alpha [Nocardioidaceae bacterium]